MGMMGLRDVFVVAPAGSFHHHLHHHHHDSSAGQNPGSLDHPMIPLLSQNPSSNLNPNSSGGMPTISYLKKPVPMFEPPSGLLGSSNLGGTATCQDCGNQAKKDCSHRRCRTCCKSRGFDCTTHVKSTWVPAARRRERQHVGLTGGAGSSTSTSAPKKPRLLSSQTTTTSHTSTSNNTPPRSFDTSSSHQDAGFRDNLPRQVRAPAVFKCVRVTSIDDGEDEYAYQAAVSIGGHVFKGFLYDQGLDDGTNHDLAGTSTSNEENNPNNIPNMSELHLGGIGGSNRDRDVPSSSPLLSSDVYGGGAAPGGGFLGGTSYGNPMN